MIFLVGYGAALAKLVGAALALAKAMGNGVQKQTAYTPKR